MSTVNDNGTAVAVKTQEIVDSCKEICRSIDETVRQSIARTERETAKLKIRTIGWGRCDARTAVAVAALGIGLFADVGCLALAVGGWAETKAAVRAGGWALLAGGVVTFCCGILNWRTMRRMRQDLADIEEGGVA